jgi:large subunit ribosomal protein L15
MKLNQLTDNQGARKKPIRVGRGIGSGKGKTGGRGGKGQTARSGVAINGFEGGQMPLFRRLPKKGFTNIFRLDFVVVNIGTLQQAIDEKRLEAGQTITVKSLKEAGIISRTLDGIRLLNKGELKSKLTIEVAGASKAAVAAVEKAGGSVVVKAPKVPAEKAAKAAKA